MRSKAERLSDLLESVKESCILAVYQQSGLPICMLKTSSTLMPQTSSRGHFRVELESISDPCSSWNYNLLFVSAMVVILTDRFLVFDRSYAPCQDVPSLLVCVETEPKYCHLQTNTQHLHREILGCQ